tara:strand:- start:15 stop:1385 length:1371 start_codon:yes stop_codon:yes gene_type:complete
MKLINQLLNNQFNFLERLSLLLFGILPISLAMGNAAININIFLIDLLFLIYCFKYKIWSWLKKDIFLYLMVLYIFLNLNSLFSYFILFENQTKPFWLDGVLTFYNDDIILKFHENDGIRRSFLFIKFILLVFAFSFLLNDNKILGLVHKSWFLIITIFIFDVFFEKFTGRNIIGNVSPDMTRIVSFFKDEMVVGAFIFCFGYASSTYLINNKEKGKSILPIMLIFLLIPLSIFVTGEKSNFLKSILVFFIIIYFLKKNEQFLNYKILLIAIFFLVSCFFIISKNTYIKYSETYMRIVVAEKNPSKEFEAQKSIWNNLTKIKYFAHYDAALGILKNYPITGIGNKNFRIECFKEKYYNKKILHSQSRCSTHPHQIHFEILSEQGILGYFMILTFIIWFSTKNIKISLKNKNIYHLSNTVYLMVFFIPLLPGSGIFNTFNGALFWVIFSLINLDYEKK